MKQARLALFAILAILLMSCARPSQHDETRWGRNKLFWSIGDWPRDRLDVFGMALERMSALGPTAVLAPDFTDDVFAQVKHWEAPDRRLAERWVPERRMILMDPANLHGDLETISALLHGYGHGNGMRHVCRRVDEVPDCSPVGYGVAVMNPQLEYDDGAGPGFDEAFTGGVPPVEYTELDLAEFRRVHP